MTKVNENIPSRYPNRASEDKSIIYSILDEGRFCTIAYVKDGKPYQIPTGFCRMGDELLIHGSSKSHFLSDLMKAGEVCISVVLFDALVLAPTAFNHSVNYRSVVIFSQPKQEENDSAKTDFFRAFTDKYVPGRMLELDNPSPDEISATTVISFSLRKATSKVRKGPVGVDTAKCDIWTGVVPASLSYGIPEADKKMKKGIATPAYLTQMVIKSNT